MAAFPTPAPQGATLAAPNAPTLNGIEPENVTSRTDSTSTFLDPGLKLPVAYAVPKDADAKAAAEGWLNQLASASDAKAFADLFIEEGWWKDRLTYTWSYRTAYKQDRIAKVFEATSKRTAATNFKLDLATPPSVLSPYPDVSYIQAHFTFDSELASNDGIVNLVKDGDSYKAWTLVTILNELKAHPERAEKAFRKSATPSNFDNEEPPVVIIGGGQSGLTLAACLDAVGIPNLVIERNERVGDTWRNRYESLHLHSPSPGDSLPYLPFPKHWPSYPSGGKVGNFLEFYADVLHLTVWTNSVVESARFDKSNKNWTVDVTRADGSKRTLKPKIVVLATGITGSVPYVPAEVQGQKDFKGKILHSSKYRNAKEFKGKNVLVVGTASTGFDIAGDLGRNGAHVTMLQRSPTYIMSLQNGIYLNGGALYFEGGPSLELADKLANALPYPMMKLFAQREVKRVAEADKKLLDGLNKAGFETNLGLDNAGHLSLGLDHSGGYYFDTGSDVGACAQIIDGRIKVARGTIKEFTADEAVLANGQRVKADAVVFSTGYQPIKNTILNLFGDEVADVLHEAWGLDQDPELKNVWKPTKYPQLYCFFSGFVMCRFNGKAMARLLAAKLDGKGDTEPVEV